VPSPSRGNWSTPRASPDEPKDAPGGNDGSSLADVLWDALRSVPEDGADVAELMRLTGLGRSAVYKYLALLTEQDRAVRVGWGRWRAADPGNGDDE
jgi:hypothetical protein